MAFDYESWRIANDAAKRDPRVKLIREDALVGMTTCSYVAESLDAVDIARELNERGIWEFDSGWKEKTLKWAYEYEGDTREFGLNHSSGEVDCHLRESYKDWQDSASVRQSILDSIKE